MHSFGNRIKPSFSSISAFLVAGGLLIMAMTVHAEGFDFYAQVNKYAKCEAVLNVMANILSDSEEEFYRHEFHHASLDSRVIALEFAKAGDLETGLVDEIFATYLDEYRNQLEINDDVEKFIAALRPYAKTCRRLNAMQSDVIARKKQQAIQGESYYLQ